jgi:hypothetical protein
MKFIKNLATNHPARFLIIFAIMGAMVGTGVLASGWITSHLTTTGIIHITAPIPPPATYSYTLNPSSNVLVFPETTVGDGASFSVNSADITIVNTGNQTITGLTLTLTGGTLPSGWTATLVATPFSSNSATFHVTIAGIAHAASAIDTTNINLSGLTFDLTPS